MTFSNRSQKILYGTIIALFAAFSVVFVMAGSIIIAALKTPSPVAAIWSEHRNACLESPEEQYHRDRSRVSGGFVNGPEGKPIAGARVRCIRLPSLLQLAESDRITPQSWSGLVETEIQTDADGHYEFPHLQEGGWTLCASAPELAPDVKSMILVQDGSGFRVDFHLEKPKTLRIVLEDASRPQRVYLVPFRWWPELKSQSTNAGEKDVHFQELGGPFRKGLIFLADLNSPESWEFKASFDLDHTDEVVISNTTNQAPSPQDIPEAACIPYWQPDMSKAGRIFFSMMNPTALFWNTGSVPIEAKRPNPESQTDRRPIENSELRGYGPSPFSPVLAESRDGKSWLQWTSAASEFAFLGLPAGQYRVRSLGAFGNVSFARGLDVPASGVVELKSPLRDKIELDKPLSREVMGMVRWEDGRPAAQAAVFFQDSMNFRKFLKRVVTDSNGFYFIPEVPSGRQYTAFAMPPEDEHAMKSFEYPVIESMPRETWLDFSLSPHAIVGKHPDIATTDRIELLRVNPDGLESVVWSVVPSKAGQMKITNVPPGNYHVRVLNRNAVKIRSLPVVVEKHQKDLTSVLRWAE